MASKREYNISNEMKDMLVKYEEYLVMLRKSEKTIEDYLSELKLLIDTENLQSIEEFSVLSKKWWLNFVDRKVKSGLSPITTTKKISYISSFYNFLLVEDLVEDNPCANLPNVNSKGLSQYKEKVMSEEDVRRLLQATDREEFQKSREKYLNLRDKLIVYLMCNVAPRIEEVSKIRLDDIVLSENKLYIRGKGGKGEITRYTNFNTKVKALIMASIQYNPNRVYLFENCYGKQLSTESIRKIWYRACDLCGIEGVNPHGVRHFVGSTLVEKGVPLKKVAQILGHASSKTSEKFYIKPKEDMNDTLDVIDIF